MADIRSNGLNRSLFKKSVDVQKFFYPRSHLINEWFLTTQGRCKEKCTPVETENVPKTCSEPKWNAYMDFFEKDAFSAESSKREGPSRFTALKGKFRFDEDNPLKDKHYRPREYMLNKWESRDNPFCNEHPLMTLNRLFSVVDANEIGSSTKIPFQQGGKCSKADRPNDFRSDGFFRSRICGNNVNLVTLQVNGESSHHLVFSRFKSLIRENDIANEKAFRNYKNPLRIITDEEFLNWPFGNTAFVSKNKCDISNAETDDSLTIEKNIMQSMLYLEEDEEEEKEKEETLPSPNKYFKPLDVLLREDQLNERNMDSFPDGTYFNVKSDFDTLNFQRSPSGSLLLESECGKVTKYLEYKYQSPTDEFMRLPRFRQSSGYQEFKVKYPVSINDKATQTGDDGDIVENMFCPSARNASTPLPDAVTASYLENENSNASTSSSFSDDFQAVAELKTLLKAEDDDDSKEVNSVCSRCALWSKKSSLSDAGIDVGSDTGSDTESDTSDGTSLYEEMDEFCKCSAKRTYFMRIVYKKFSSRRMFGFH
ncbi:uncharacterized protein LOC109539280 [Dendroctonus ponderosae]|uniref:uncharacterized protein LOC109539280 n=1 Tax=Dendroctonus ponderosae TaxID=77166 RepID=UPI00203582A2|nr:uncharacterized protein LOC109539280 [Dendroctonus ponderosae]